jgi:uncharacterized protein
VTRLLSRTLRERSFGIASPLAQSQGGAVPSEALSPLALSDDEYAALGDVLAAHSSFDIDGFLGILHAVAVAPSLLPPSAWLPVVFPDGFGGDTDFADAVNLALRLHNEVLDACDEHYPLVPEQDDIVGYESFAAGYATGAKLDPLWYGNANRWTFAAPAAYLGGRLDLVPADMLAKIEAGPDPKSLIRRDLAGLINAAQSSFLAVRRDALSQATRSASAGTPRPPRVGRNDPCPCGSGKKHKRCCLDGDPAVGAR